MEKKLKFYSIKRFFLQEIYFYSFCVEAAESRIAQGEGLNEGTSETASFLGPCQDQLTTQGVVSGEGGTDVSSIHSASTSAPSYG